MDIGEARGGGGEYLAKRGAELWKNICVCSETCALPQKPPVRCKLPKITFTSWLPSRNVTVHAHKTWCQLALVKPDLLREMLLPYFRRARSSSLDLDMKIIAVSESSCSHSRLCRSDESILNVEFSVRRLKLLKKKEKEKEGEEKEERGRTVFASDFITIGGKYCLGLGSWAQEPRFVKGKLFLRKSVETSSKCLARSAFRPKIINSSSSTKRPVEV